MERLTNKIERDLILICNPQLIGNPANEYIKLYEYENTGLEPKEIEKLKSELEELKKKAIVPKFKVGECYFMIYRYSVNENWKIFKCVIRAYKSTNDILVIICDSKKPEQLISWVDNLIFTTQEEAEDALKKLLEKDKI